MRWLAAVLDGLSAGLTGVAVTPYMQVLAAPPPAEPDPIQVRTRIRVFCADCDALRTSTAPRWRCDTCGSASLAFATKEKADA